MFDIHCFTISSYVHPDRTLPMTYLGFAPYKPRYSVLTSCQGKAHVHSSQHNDSRWYSFFDHAVAHDRQWHIQAMTHAYSWYLEGVDPWGMKKQDPTLSEQEASSYSLRVSAWNVHRLKCCR